MTKRNIRIRRNIEINYCKEKENKNKFFCGGGEGGRKLFSVFIFHEGSWNITPQKRGTCVYEKQMTIE